MKTYTVIFEPAPNNWAASAPDVPGCVATGKTREECAETFREALEFHFEALRLRGEPIPRAREHRGGSD